MSYSELYNLFLISLALMVLFLVLSVFLFFKLNIPETIGFLSGRTAKKEITKKLSSHKSMRDTSSNLASKSYRERNKQSFTDKISENQQNFFIDKQINESEVSTYENIEPSYSTYVNKTEILEQPQVDEKYSNETTLLSETNKSSNEVFEEFEIDVDITFIQSDEILSFGGNDENI